MQAPLRQRSEFPVREQCKLLRKRKISQLDPGMAVGVANVPIGKGETQQRAYPRDPF